MSEPVYVTRAEQKAARRIVERNAAAGRDTPWTVVKIAEAKAARTPRSKRTTDRSAQSS